MTIEEALSDPSKVGVIGLLSIAILAFLRGWVVTAQQFSSTCAQYEKVIDELKQEKNEYRGMVIQTIQTADRALKVAQTKTGE